MQRIRQTGRLYLAQRIRCFRSLLFEILKLISTRTVIPAAERSVHHPGMRISLGTILPSFTIGSSSR